jgi:uncharacterized metal-binding protein YceD (DUF177 family)
MNEQQPEFSRIVRLNEVGDGRRERHIVADDGERVALARRFGLITLDRLEATLTVAPDPLGWRVAGRFSASLEQPCVATGDPVAASLDQPFALIFVREGEASGEISDEEIELSDEDCDVIPLEGEKIDIGEAVAQSLSLALDPYPRVADADARLKALGVMSEEDAGPFAALAALRKSAD